MAGHVARTGRSKTRTYKIVEYIFLYRTENLISYACAMHCVHIHCHHLLQPSYLISDVPKFSSFIYSVSLAVTEVSRQESANDRIHF